MRHALCSFALAAALILFCAAPAVADVGPALTVSGTGIPETTSVGSDVLLRIVVLAGTPVEYCWTAAETAAPLATMRYGWHVVDFADEDDPGWSIPETSYDGTETCSDVRQFLQGVPNFVVQVTDADGIVTRVIVLMQIDQSVPSTSVTWGAVKARF